MGFRLFISMFLVMDVLWLWLADRRLRAWSAARPHIRLWRGLLAGMVALQFAALAVWFLPAEVSRAIQRDMPRVAVQMMFIWHLVVLPAGVVLFTLEELGTKCLDVVLRFPFFRGRSCALPAADFPASETGDQKPEAPLTLSRRQWLGVTLAAAPPILLTGGTGLATHQLGQFSVTRKSIAVPALPPELDGLTIAHVSDTHIGRFSDDDFLNHVAEQTNRLDADLVLFTGDLIDFSLRDLPPALEMAKRFTARHAVAFCVGNHDLIDSADQFVTRTRSAGLPMLVNDFTNVTFRGRKIQILGSPWSRAENGTATAVRSLAPRLDPDAFPILLAHHPHAFDYAADLNIPLTLAGHTHGGQLMLTPSIGPGPLMYRYWSGIYRKPNATLHVSNGVGNWFPLRLNAPAEISLLTLRQA